MAEKDTGGFKLDKSGKALYPIEPVCIVTYLRMADEGIIEISNDEYMYFLEKLRRKQQEAGS